MACNYVKAKKENRTILKCCIKECKYYEKCEHKCNCESIQDNCEYYNPEEEIECIYEYKHKDDN